MYRDIVNLDNMKCRKAKMIDSLVHVLMHEKC